MAQGYTGFVWNKATNHMIIKGAEAETPEAAKEEMLKHLQPFCEVQKVVTDEAYAKARSRNPGKRVPDLYYLV